METELPKVLTSLISGELIPGACVAITSNEVVTTPPGIVGIIGIRKSLAMRGLTIGATLVPSEWSGKLTIQLINHSNKTVEIHKGDELVNIAYLVEMAG